nr:PGR5-like protein 1A, chloroplastic [Tanacetum cinerariifolium]
MSHTLVVEYEDGDEKLVTLSKEIIKFHVSPEEIKCLRLTCDLYCSETDYLDVNEMILLTSNLDDCHDIELGDIIWDKLTGLQDLTVDYLKMFLINAPAAVVAVGLFFFLDDITGFEITYLLELPEPFSFIFTWFAALPFLLWLSFTLTNVIVRDFLILKRNSFNGIVYFQVIRMLNNVTRMAVGMSDLGSQTDTYADMKPTRHARRIYFCEHSPTANEQSVATYFSHVMSAIGGNTVGPGSTSKVRRPSDYYPSLAATLGPSQPNPNPSLGAVEAQARELLESFVALRGFDLMKDRETGNSKGYALCVYQDLSVTNIACAALLKTQTIFSFFLQTTKFHRVTYQILPPLPFSSTATFANIMCRQPLPPPLSSPSAMIMDLEEYGYQSRRGIRVPNKWMSFYFGDVILKKGDEGFEDE